MLIRASLASALMLILVACGGPQKGASSQPAGKAGVEFRLLSPTETGGEQVSTWDGKMKMAVEAKVWFTDRDIETVKLENLPDGSPAINIQLDPTASLALEDLTTKNRGRRIGVLVGGKIVAAPTIKDMIKGGLMTIVGQTPDETRTIYKHMTGK